MSLQDQITAGFAEAQELLQEDEPFLLEGLPYRGIINRVSDSTPMTDTAFMENYDAVIVSTKGQFFKKPLTETLVKFDGKEYRVKSVETDTVHYTLNLNRDR